MGNKILNVLLILWAGVILSCNSDKTTALMPEAEREAVPPPSVAEIKKSLTDRGYQTFDYVDEKSGDTILMQQYYIAFLKSGPNRSQSKEEADSLQALHLSHLARMYEEGHADISGPFGDDGEIRGITIYNTPTLEMADSLANMDPMVRAGRLVIEIHPWWAAKGFPLR
jgi:uncharacterized protein YciI